MKTQPSFLLPTMEDEKKLASPRVSSLDGLPDDGLLSSPPSQECASEPTPLPPSSESGQNAPPPGPPKTAAKPPHPMAKFAVYRSPPRYKTPYNVDKKLYAKRVMLPANITLQREQTQKLTNEVGGFLVDLVPVWCLCGACVVPVWCLLVTS